MLTLMPQRLPHWTSLLRRVAVLCLMSSSVASAQDQTTTWTGIGPFVGTATSADLNGGAVGGSGYVVNDVLTLNGTYTTAAQFTVTQVSDSGAVAAVSLQAAGAYTSLPSGPIATTGGSGTGCTLNVTWSGAYIKTVTIDPVTPSTTYAGLVEDQLNPPHPIWGVFKTLDGGQTWNPARTGLPGQDYNVGVFALVIDPGATTTLYAGLNANYYSGGYGYDAGGTGGVYRSLDGGASWSLANNGLPGDVNVLSLAIDPRTTPSTVYVGTDSAGVFVSVDGGNTWTDFNMGLPSNLAVPALAIDHATPSTIYAGTEWQGIFKETDGDGAWTSISAGLPSTVSISTLAIDPRTMPATLYAGIDGYYGGTGYGDVFKKSIDGQDTWSAVDNGLDTTIGVHAIAVDTVTGALYVGTVGSGVFMSTDLGVTWRASNAGLTDLTIHAITPNPLAPNNIFVGTCSEGVFTGTTPGAAFTVTGAPGTLDSGELLNVQWTAPSGESATDWIGLYHVGDPNTAYAWWASTNGATSGTFTLAAPDTPGAYEFRYLLGDSLIDEARSNTVTVSAPADAWRAGRSGSKRGHH
jgi:hypothetical protein